MVYARLTMSILRPCPPATRLTHALALPLVLTGMLSGLIPQGAQAQDTPGTSQVIPRDTLLAAPSGRLEDALAGMAGLSGYTAADSRASNPAEQSITTRALGGNSASRTLVLLDGVPVADPFFGYVPWGALAIERLGGAQITRGAALAPGAVAGTLALTRATPATLGLFSAEARGANTGDQQAAITLAPHIGAGYVTAGASMDRGGDFWTTPTNQRGPGSIRAAYDSWSASGGVVMPIGPLVADAHILDFDDRRTMSLAGEDSLSHALDATLGLTQKGAWGWSARGFWQAHNYEAQAISPITGRRVAADYATPSHASGALFAITPPAIAGQHLTLGADMHDITGEADDAGYNLTTAKRNLLRWAGGRMREDGVYAQDASAYGALALNAGASAERWSMDEGFIRQATGGGTITLDQTFPARHGWQSSLRAEARLALGGGVTLRSAAYTGFRLPTLNELYHPALQPAGPTYAAITTLPNPALAPERLAGFEAGFDWRPTPAASLTITVFADRLAHAILDVPTQNTPAAITLQRENVGAIRSHGLEADGHMRAGRLTVSGSLSYADARIAADGTAATLNGQAPARSPALVGRLGLDWRAGDGFDLGAALNHAGPTHEDDPAQDRLPATTTMDAWASLALGARISLVLRAQNLTDTAIVTHDVAGRRDLAAPRTLWVGIRAALR